METEHEDGPSQEIDIVRKDAETRCNKNRTNIKRIFHIGVWPGDSEDLILLEMSRCPDSYPFSQEDQDDPYNDPRGIGFRKDHQQESPDE
jgi:hypothetical protein